METFQVYKRQTRADRKCYGQNRKEVTVTDCWPLFEHHKKPPNWSKCHRHEETITDMYNPHQEYKATNNNFASVETNPRW